MWMRVKWARPTIVPALETARSRGEIQDGARAARPVLAFPWRVHSSSVSQSLYFVVDWEMGNRPLITNRLKHARHVDGSGKRVFDFYSDTSFSTQFLTGIPSENHGGSAQTHPLATDTRTPRPLAQDRFDPARVPSDHLACPKSTTLQLERALVMDHLNQWVERDTSMPVAD